MSNEVVKNEKANINETAQTETAPAKEGIIAKAVNGCRKVRDKVRSTKGGRALIRIGKGIAIGVTAYEAYRLGQKSVKSTTVCIESGVTDEDEVEETTEENEEVKEQE